MGEAFVDSDIANGIKNAMLDLEKNLSDKEIAKNYRCVMREKRKRDCPKVSMGSFCIAFQLKHITNGNNICYRIWHKRPSEIGKRYSLIMEYLRKTSLSYFVPFTYIDKALRVGDKVVPGCRMDWVEGQNLFHYIKGANDEQLQSLPRKFMDMCVSMRSHHISHGDLSCRNMSVTPNDEFKLVDYDSLYVPEMKDDFLQVIVGSVNFQHPERLAKTHDLHVSLEDDNFSQQVIFLSLLAIAHDSSLREMCDIDAMLFIQQDFENDESFIQSEGFKSISKIQDNEVNFYLKNLRTAVSLSLDKVPSIVVLNALYQQKFGSRDVGAASAACPLLANYCVRCRYKFLHEDELFCKVCGTARRTMKFN